MSRNNEVLRNLMSEYKLRQKDIVTLMTSDYGTISKVAVEKWIYDERNMPGPMLELLIFKIKDVLAQQHPDQD
jgi:hypothetical protein